MYFYCKNRKERIVHTIECIRMHNTNVKNIGVFEVLSDAYKQGYRFCKCCNPLSKSYEKESKAIIEFCRKKGLSVILSDKNISVYSVHSQWKIILDENSRMVLYHKNEFQTNKDHISEVIGYHLQKSVRKNSIIDYLKYIVEHDYYRMINPVQMPKKKAEPPRKGTKRYKTNQKKIEKTARKRAIRKVLTLIDSLNVQSAQRSCVAQS